LVVLTEMYIFVSECRRWH